MGIGPELTSRRNVYGLQLLARWIGRELSRRLTISMSYDKVKMSEQAVPKRLDSLFGRAS